MTTGWSVLLVHWRIHPSFPSLGLKFKVIPIPIGYDTLRISTHTYISPTPPRSYMEQRSSGASLILLADGVGCFHQRFSPCHREQTPFCWIGIDRRRLLYSLSWFLHFTKALFIIFLTLIHVHEVANVITLLEIRFPHTSQAAQPPR